MSLLLRARGCLLAALLFALFFLSHLAPAQAVTPGWQPNRTWVFAVSALKFQDKQVFDSFPTENRRDDQLVQFFRGRGVPTNHIVYCKDKAATLRTIQTSFKTLLQKAAPGDTLFFYYQGHGYPSEDKSKPDTYFATYDTDGEDVPGWSVKSISAMIDRTFKGQRALLSADCCYSGTLAGKIKGKSGRVQYACLTSSSAREVSTGHWTFSQCLLDALNSAPFIDANRDGTITLAELAELAVHAHDDMAIAEEQHATFALAGGFPATMPLAVAQQQPRAPIGLCVKAKQGGTWYAARIVAKKSGQLLVSYIGYDEDPEWFDAGDTSQIRLIAAQTAKPKFAAGARVEVKWKGDWYDAKVLKVDKGVYFIHYIEDDSSWDEWVSSKRIRTRQE